MEHMMKIEIITRSSKFEDLKESLSRIGISGMTVTQVLGCGSQKDTKEYYRGVPYETRLFPKVKVEIVSAEKYVNAVVQTAKDILNTGKVGDGKIFISDISNAIRIRTGEEGEEAL